LAIAISAFDPRPANSFFFTPLALLIGPAMLIAYTIRWSDLNQTSGIKWCSIKRLKDVPGMKPLYLGLVWSSLAYLAADCVPWSVAPVKIGCVCALIFFRTFGDAIALDLRDIRADLANNVPTFAVMYGEKTVYYLLQLCNVIVTMIPLVCIFLGLLPAISIGWTFHGVWACCWGKNFHWSRRQYTLFYSDVAIGLARPNQKNITPRVAPLWCHSGATNRNNQA
jgi:4-hydroxybenzoate polyprenyltransferase